MTSLLPQLLRPPADSIEGRIRRAVHCGPTSLLSLGSLSVPKAKLDVSPTAHHSTRTHVWQPDAVHCAEHSRSLSGMVMPASHP